MEEKPSVCLVMIVRDEADIIERSLLSAKPYIHSWLIYDTGSSDNTINIINNLMVGLPGEVQKTELHDFSLLKNRLLKSAKNLADLILMLDADEEINTLESSINLPDQVDIGFVNITHKNYTTRAPRVFRGNAVPTFQGTLGEKLTTAVAQPFVFQTLSFHHYQNGFRHRQNSDYLIKRRNIESVLQKKPLHSAESLEFAKTYIRYNKIDQAMAYLHSVIKQSSDQEELWIAKYLVANINITENKIEQAIASFGHCFELDSSRPEPLMRIAEIHYENKDYLTTKELCKLIIDVPKPPHAHYFEPSIYDYRCSLLLAKTHQQLGEFDEAINAIPDLEKRNQLPSKIQTQFNEIIEGIPKPESLAKNLAKPNNLTSSSTSSTTKEPSPILTIGMATHDDFDGVYFSVMSIVLYHSSLLDQIEILVVDNNPESKHGLAVKDLCNQVKQARYVPAMEYNGTSIRERVFTEAKAKFVLCIDCHVFLHSDSIARLLEYFKSNPDSNDLLQGPLFMGDDSEEYYTHMEPEWNAGFYGAWGTDPRGAKTINKPFEISLHGMGLVACVRKYWPGYNHRFRGFGADEGYLHEKTRQHGGRVLCLPFLRWTHRFQRPTPPSYENRWGNRIRNHLIGWSELGLDTKPIINHFTNLIGEKQLSIIHANFLREQKGSLWKYDTIYAIATSDELWENLQTPFRGLAIEIVAQRVKSPKELPRLLNEAKHQNLDNVLILNSNQDKAFDAKQVLSAIHTAENNNTDIAVTHIGLPKNKLYNEENIILIQNSGFIATSLCLEKYQQLSQAYINKVSSKTSFTEQNYTDNTKT